MMMIMEGGMTRRWGKRMMKWRDDQKISKINREEEQQRRDRMNVAPKYKKMQKALALVD